MARLGRPPLDAADPSVAVTVAVPSRQYDRLYAEARRQRVTVPELIRRSLAPTKNTETRPGRPRSSTLIR